MNPTKRACWPMFFLEVGRSWWETAPGVLAVPFLAHRPDQAAAAALAMVLDYYGETAPGCLLQEPTQDGGWGDDPRLPRQLSNEARQAGYDAAVAAGSILRLEEWLRQGVPVLVFPDAEIRGAGEPVAVVTGLTRDRAAVCLHYGDRANQWLRVEDFLALCGGPVFTAVPVAEKQLASHARVRARSRRPGLTRDLSRLPDDPIPALAA
jgi:hypothetical protein